MKNQLKSLLLSTMLLATLVACSEEQETTTPSVTPPATSTTTPDATEGSTDEGTEEGTNDVILPEQYANVDENIANAIISVKSVLGEQYMPTAPFYEDMLFMYADQSAASPEAPAEFDSSLYTNFYGESMMMGVKIDRLLVFETENVEEITALLTAYVENEQNNIQYPMNVSRWQEVKVVTIAEKYVALVATTGHHPEEDQGEVTDEALAELAATNIDLAISELSRVLDGGDPDYSSLEATGDMGVQDMSMENTAENHPEGENSGFVEVPTGDVDEDLLNAPAQNPDDADIEVDSGMMQAGS